MQKVKEKIIQNIGVLGEITAEFFDQRTLSKEQRKINKKLDEKFNLGLISRKDMLDNYIFGKKCAYDFHKNVITNVGFNAVAVKRMIGNTTYTGKVNKALLGTGVGTAGVADTQLINETYRTDVVSGSESGNIAYLTILFTETEVTGTFKEFGNAIDGAAGANTGALFSHITGLNWVKNNTTALVISCKYTFASV